MVDLLVRVPSENALEGKLKISSDSMITLSDLDGTDQAAWSMDDNLDVTVKFLTGTAEGKKVKLPLCYISDIYKLYKAYEQTQKPEHRCKFYTEL